MPQYLAYELVITGDSASGRTTVYNHIVMREGDISKPEIFNSYGCIIMDLINVFNTARADLGRISPGVFFETMDSEV